MISRYGPEPGWLCHCSALFPSHPFRPQWPQREHCWRAVLYLTDHVRLSFLSSRSTLNSPLFTSLTHIACSHRLTERIYICGRYRLSSSHTALRKELPHISPGTTSAFHSFHKPAAVQTCSGAREGRCIDLGAISKSDTKCTIIEEKRNVANFFDRYLLGRKKEFLQNLSTFLVSTNVTFSSIVSTPATNLIAPTPPVFDYSFIIFRMFSLRSSSRGQAWLRPCCHSFRFLWCAWHCWAIGSATG